MEEPFDEAEVTGVIGSGGNALIRPTAGMTEPYYTETAIPLIYQGYPFGQIRMRNRDGEEMGVPPIRSIFVYRPYFNAVSVKNRPILFPFPYSYETAMVVELDYMDLYTQISNYRESVPANVYNRIVYGNWLPFIKYGEYKIILQYVLPDGTKTSSSEFNFMNFFEANK
jgi:hypothetical protein